MEFLTDPVLATLWFAAICLMVALYILLDGADLGLGVLSLLPIKEDERSLMMHTMGPIWDANETWLIVAAGMLFGAFPTAYGVILSALYIPVMVMLFGLILRAASFEFHAFSVKKRLWSLMFGVGSLLAAVGQGLAVGGLLSGIQIADGYFAGTAFDFITPLSLIVTVGVVMSYVFVGYAFLIKKTGKETKPGTFMRILITGAITGAALLAATLFLPSRSYLFFARWTMYPTNYVLFAIAGLIGVFSLWVIILVFRKHTGGNLHTLCMIIFILAMLGMLVGIFPYVIPGSLTIFEAASSRQTLEFMLFGLGPLIPIVLAYNFYLHKVFGRSDHPNRSEAYGE
ncbi:MAG: Cytochrome d ubiquinol oxidase subunit [Parcubacteria group bacterium]|nr:Cytochrome d ubiquinol oxidase subunit [Parcubacteria group bacterium]